MQKRKAFFWSQFFDGDRGFIFHDHILTQAALAMLLRALLKVINSVGGSGD
jgi:hypothetical protein